jgi:hypothetical protein
VSPDSPEAPSGGHYNSSTRNKNGFREEAFFVACLPNGGENASS